MVVNGRDAARTEATAREIAAATGVEAIPVAADLSTEEGRAAVIAAAPHADILINNNGGPPARDYRELDRAALLAGIEANMIAPIVLIQALLDGMVERRFGRVVNITSGSVRMPLPGLDLSSGARAGLTGFVAGIARQVAHANVTINALLPGAFDTDRIAALNESIAKRDGRPVEEVRAARIAGIPARRFGTAREFGRACAFLCSSEAGYITGQNLLIDGGLFPGAF